MVGANQIKIYLFHIADEYENDGGWSEWSSFGNCSISAGSCKRTRHRNCDSPERSERGLPCVGPDTDTEDCEEDKCDGRYLRKCHKLRNIIMIKLSNPCHFYFLYVLLFMVIDCLSPWNRPRPDSLCYMVSDLKVNWTQANQVSWKRLSVYINSKYIC